MRMETSMKVKSIKIKIKKDMVSWLKLKANIGATGQVIFVHVEAILKANYIFILATGIITNEMGLALKLWGKIMNIMKEITRMNREMDSEFGKSLMEKSTLGNGKIIKRKVMELIMMERDCIMKELGKMMRSMEAVNRCTLMATYTKEVSNTIKKMEKVISSILANFNTMVSSKITPSQDSEPLRIEMEMSMLEIWSAVSTKEEENSLTRTRLISTKVNGKMERGMDKARKDQRIVFI